MVTDKDKKKMMGGMLGEETGKKLKDFINAKDISPSKGKLEKKL